MCSSHVLWPRDGLIPRRGRLVDVEPALEPRDAEVHRDGEGLAAVVDLADFANVEAERQIQPLSVGNSCEIEHSLNFHFPLQYSLPTVLYGWV